MIRSLPRKPVSLWPSSLMALIGTLLIGALVILGTSSLVWVAPAQALPPGNAVTEGKALLRYALPIDNKPIREVQSNLESMADALRARRISAINRSLDTIQRALRNESVVLNSVQSDRQAEATSLLAQLMAGVDDLRLEVQAKNRDAIWAKRGQLLDVVGALEELMVTKFPFEVPAEYSNLPQLKGRATVEIVTDKGTMTAVVDGYSAPVTAGNFVDLVQRGFYDGLEFNRVEEFYVAQVGDPPGDAIGFVDPATKEYRSIPLEILVEGDAKPLYGLTLETAGRYLDQPVLPFSAYGALGMAHGNDANDASSQFFFFLFEPELTPAGLNLMDGRYAVFGYVTENKEVLDKIRLGDRIISAKVVSGLENLVQP